MAFVSIVTAVLASGVDERAIALQLEKQQANPEASYVLHEFPDADHHAAIILSQGDTAKVCFALCFDAAVLGDSDPRLIATMPNQVRIRRAACIRRMYLLLVAGARTGPGEIQHETSRRFPGDAGFQERLREQLWHEFGVDPLVVGSDTSGLVFAQSEVDSALHRVYGHDAPRDFRADRLCGEEESDEPGDEWINDVYVPGGHEAGPNAKDEL